MSVVALAVVNIGYFSVVGIHFLGLIDVSNIVYPFGLAFGLFSVMLTFANGDLAGWIGREAAKDESILRLLLMVWKFFLLPVLTVSALGFAVSHHFRFSTFLERDPY